MENFNLFKYFQTLLANILSEKYIVVSDYELDGIIG